MHHALALLLAVAALTSAQFRLLVPTPVGHDILRQNVSPCGGFEPRGRQKNGSWPVSVNGSPIAVSFDDRLVNRGKPAHQPQQKPRAELHQVREDFDFGGGTTFGRRNSTAAATGNGSGGGSGSGDVGSDWESEWELWGWLDNGEEGPRQLWVSLWPPVTTKGRMGSYCWTGVKFPRTWVHEGGILQVVQRRNAVERFAVGLPPSVFFHWQALCFLKFPSVYCGSESEDRADDDISVRLSSLCLVSRSLRVQNARMLRTPRSPARLRTQFRGRPRPRRRYPPQ
jgi:hypothetical protein